MSPDDAMRILRTLRFSPQAGRPVSFHWIGAQAGYDPVSIYRCMRRGWMTQRMADRLEPPLTVLMQTATVLDGQNAKSSTLGVLGGGRDPRGGARTRKRTIGTPPPSAS